MRQMHRWLLSFFFFPGCECFPHLISHATGRERLPRLKGSLSPRGGFDVSDVALSKAGDDVTGAARAYLRRAPPANMKADGADCAATNRQSNPLLLNVDFKNAL